MSQVLLSSGTTRQVVRTVFYNYKTGVKSLFLTLAIPKRHLAERATVKIKDLTPLSSDPIIFERYQDHKKLLDIKGPAIIIAGSGMCTGGRIVDHLKHGLEDPANDIFFVGYQAKGTPGRKMIDKKMVVKAGIHTLTAYSAHADQQMLVNWVHSMPRPPKEIRLVHGEADARHALGLALNGNCQE